MTQTVELTSEQRELFLADGAVRLPGAIPPDAVEAMAARIWAALERQLGAVRDRPETWTRRDPPQLKRMVAPSPS